MLRKEDQENHLPQATANLGQAQKHPQRAKANPEAENPLHHREKANPDLVEKTMVAKQMLTEIIITLKEVKAKQQPQLRKQNLLLLTSHGGAGF